VLLNGRRYRRAALAAPPGAAAQTVSEGATP
jgi:hypothetical protein